MSIKIHALALLALAVCQAAYSEDTRKDEWKKIKDTPTGTFVLNGYTWNYYANTSYGYATVWPAEKVEGDIILPDSVDGLPIGEFFDVNSSDSGWTLSVPGTVRELGEDNFVSRGPWHSGDGLDRPDLAISNLVVRDDVSIPTIIMYNGFRGFISLQSVSLGEGVIRIEGECFVGCTNLSSVTLPSTLRAIEHSAFDPDYNCGYYADPDRIKVLEGDEYGNYYIGKWLITGSDGYHIREDTKGLADEAFAFNYDYNGGLLPDGIEYLGTISCPGFDLSIPDSVKFIGNDAFGFGGEWGDTSLMYIDGWCFGPNDLSAWSKIEGTDPWELDENGGDEQWRQFVLAERERLDPQIHLKIKPGTKGIVSGAFNASGVGDNYVLKTIEFPDSLKYIGDNAFERCFELKSFNTPTNVETIGRFAFSQCEKLEEVHLGPKLKTLEEGVFYEIYNLTNVYCHADYFEELSLYAYYFSKYDWHTEVIDGREVRVYDREYFVTKNLHLYSKIKFVGTYAWKSANLIFEEGVTDIGQVIGGEGTGEVVIPSSVTNISDNAFDACPNLSNVVIKIVNSSDVKFTGKVFTDKYQIKVVALPYNAKGYEDLIAQLGEDKVKFIVGTEEGFGQWVLVNGLAGKGSAADFGGKSGGNKYENGFLYIFGNEIESESVQLIQLDKTKDGRIAFRLPETEHEDKVRVVGTSDLNDWSNAVELKKEGDVWVMPDGTKPPESFFCRVIISE